jgi:hypothetical protein
VVALQKSGYDVVGNLSELRPHASQSPRARPHEVTDKQLLDAAVHSLAAILVDEYRRVEDGRLTISAAEQSGRTAATLRAWAEKMPGWQRMQPWLSRRLDERRADR